MEVGERKKLLKRGRWIETVSLVYNICEVIVSVTVGIMTGSSALISWGLDGSVEGGSAATMIWRLHGEEAGIDPDGLRYRKKNCTIGYFCCFLDCCGFYSV
jgi:hypothetical protein